MPDLSTLHFYSFNSQNNAMRCSYYHYPHFMSMQWSWKNPAGHLKGESLYNLLLHSWTVLKVIPFISLFPLDRSECPGAFLVCGTMKAIVLHYYYYSYYFYYYFCVKSFKSLFVLIKNTSGHEGFSEYQHFSNKI